MATIEINLSIYLQDALWKTKLYVIFLVLNYVNIANVLIW